MVEVFKTNISDAAAAENIRIQLQDIFPGSRIVFDLEDCDKILKVAIQDHVCNLIEIESLVINSGYSIERLD